LNSTVHDFGQEPLAALAAADTAYVLETGRVTVSGPAVEIWRDNRVHLGVWEGSPLDYGQISVQRTDI
jgi:hypothetical protein